jgi:hypothetical protein
MPSDCWGEDSDHIRTGAKPPRLTRLFAFSDLFEGSASCLLPLQPPQVLDDLRRLLLGS